MYCVDKLYNLRCVYRELTCTEMDVRTLVALPVLLGYLCGCSRAVDICGRYPRPDPCLPGGIWDPILDRCSGYLGLDCYQCYSGQFCKTKENPATCQLLATEGNPLVISQYWLNKTVTEPCTTILAHYRSAYQRSLDPVKFIFVLAPLEEAIVQLHSVTNNVETSGYHIIGGMGATMVIHCILIALSNQILENCQSDCPPYVDVLVQSPYYAGYPDIVSLVSTTRWNTSADPSSPYTIEILTYPNNPNGARKRPLVQDQSRVIRDMVYYWPMYTTVDERIAEPIMVFSSSKHGGLAGSRFGWALVQDEDLAQRMGTALDKMVLSLSVDSQLRVLSNLVSVMSQPATPSGLLPFHQYGKDIMQSRFERLSKVMTCADLTNYPSNSTGAYAWVKCSEGVDCSKFFEAVNLIAAPGVYYGGTSQYVRLTLLLPDAEFNVLEEKVILLCDRRYKLYANN